MSWRIWKVLFPVALLLLAGCGSFDTPPPLPCMDTRIRPGQPVGYWTAHQAYELVRPVILAWHSDAVIIGGWAEFYRYHSEWGMQPDGTAPGWVFHLESEEGQARTDVGLWNGQIYLGLLDFGCCKILEISGGKFDLGDCEPQELPGGGRLFSPENYLRMDQVIGSDQVLAIVKAQGLGLEELTLLELDTYNELWELEFSPPRGRIYRYIIIDARSGAVLRNDFAGPSGASGEQGPTGP